MGGIANGGYQMRKAYLVNTEHDGTIAVYSNIKSARGKAIAYAKGYPTKWHNPRSGDDALESKDEWHECYQDINRVFIEILPLRN